mgnify:CR=1 FL=1
MSNAKKLEHWKALFTQFRECTLTVAEFCRQHGVPVHQFYYWRERVGALPTEDSALVPLHFLNSSASKYSSELSLRLPNGAEVIGLSVGQLQNLLPDIASL